MWHLIRARLSYSYLEVFVRMRRLIAMFLILVGLAAQAQATPTPKPTATPALTKAQREKLEEMKVSAPADEYFGKMKMSFLGIDNTFRDQAIRAGAQTIDQSVINKLDYAADALADWQHKYPRDPQIARSMWLGSLVYLKIWNAGGQNRAAYYLITLRNHFPHTFFGKQAKAELSRGLTMHIYEAAQPCILLADTVPPTPVPVPTPSKQNNIKVQTIPQPCYAVTPAPSASPFATPTGGGGKHPVPSPSPSPSASPSPLPSPSSSPSPANSPNPPPSGSSPPGQHAHS